MNYRHSFHAGNSADVVKHSLLIALVRALQQKPGALTLIDTHSGCGLYDLGGEEARRTGEATQGVLRAFADPNPLLDDYRAAVQAVNAEVEPRFYPGSPRFLAQLLRPQDFLILNEKHPEDAYALRGAMRDTSAAVHQRDAYELWLALLPTRTARGVVVVEAEIRSGSLITARLAAEQGRDVFAVPGSPLDPRARGPNELLRQGAILCEGIEDIDRAFNTLRTLREPPADQMRFDGDIDDAFLDRVAALLSPTPTPRDEIARALNIPVSQVAAALLELSLTGRAELLPGGLASI